MESVAPQVADAVPPKRGSALGLGLGGLRIRLDGASARTTARDTEIVSGTFVGGEPERVVVQVDDRMSEPTVAQRTFKASVKLLPGVNLVRIRAADSQGAEVQEVVTIHYVPPQDVAIISPRDGHTLAADDPPLVEVVGQVADSAVSTVWIVANDRRVKVPVTGGRFRHVIPVLEPTLRVQAETGSDGRRSATVSVHAAAAMPSIGLLLTDWPRAKAGPAHVTVMWRANAAKLDGAVQRIPLLGTSDNGEAGGDFFYLRNARPGVYTFVLTSLAAAAETVHPVLYVAGGGNLARALPPTKLNPTGRTIIARLLLPQGVLWDQDDWFTGRSASGDTVTKFRFPDGISWTENVWGLDR